MTAFITRRDAALRLKVSIDTIDRLIKRGELKVVFVTVRRPRILESSLVAMLARRQGLIDAEQRRARKIERLRAGETLTSVIGNTD